MNVPKTDGVCKSSEKIIILEKDLDKRKYRVMTFCNPNLSKSFSPQCVITWKSIKDSEKYIDKLKK